MIQVCASAPKDPKILRGGPAEEQRLEHDAQRAQNWKRWEVGSVFGNAPWLPRCQLWLRVIALPIELTVQMESFK
jgi:hypothetical protein